ncbi:hypothetical protein FF38_11131 [Lucilia cuprina]|uniref:Uncharacterized protein n=1 Tax=Lucilia cuprina TaxID=7375 RepID=A0A0L0BVP9_LUCCU|nr:hypothetical protein FF38_11131 [Lucilia cuprina]
MALKTPLALDHFRHNTADLGSRGLTAKDLQSQ